MPLFVHYQKPGNMPRLRHLQIDHCLLNVQSHFEIAQMVAWSASNVTLESLHLTGALNSDIDDGASS
jgi:hypothetical protein